jgi:hypothetical protein
LRSDLDDLDPEIPESIIEEYAIEDAEGQLRKSADFTRYGKTWIFQAIYHT